MKSYTSFFHSPFFVYRLYNKCWGKKNRAYEKNIKKVEHKFEKSVKIELTKNQNGGQNYALHLFYRKTNRIARHNNK